MRPTSMRPLLLSLSIAAALGVVASGCQRSPSPEPATPAPAAQPATTAEKISDEHSYAEPDKVQTTDLALDLAIDFAQKQIRGTATYSLEWLDQNANQLLLDTRAISIQKAEGLGADLWLLGRDFRFHPAPGQERQQWNWIGRHKRYPALAAVVNTLG